MSRLRPFAVSAAQGDVVTMSNRMQYDVVVAGAGAAGLMAAIFAGRSNRDLRIAVVDSARKIGAKILISGGGRCNVTHHRVTADDFNGNRNSIARILRTFTVEQTIEFFRDIGVELKREETGKLFPVTDRARTVVDALLRAADDAGVDVLTETRVVSAFSTASAGEKVAEGRMRGPSPGASRHPLPQAGEGTAVFSLETSRGVITARRVVLATGGRSVPKTGSDGHGYTIVSSLGHSVTDVFPALVPLVIDEAHWIRELSGTSADVELAVRAATGRILARQSGSMLMTHFGISGPVALDISRHWIAARRDDPAAGLTASFLPGQSFERLDQRLVDAGRRNPQATVASVLRGSIPERVLDKLTPAIAISRLPREERRRIVRDLTELTIPVARDRGFDYAEVTAGGVPLSEIDPATMASRRCPGLFLCGEVLDVDGRIGGFNFQWAWTSGRLAGLNCATFA